MASVPWAGAVATPKLNFTPHRGLGEAPVGGAPQALGDDEGAALVRLREQQRELLARDAGRDVDAPLPLERVPRDRLKRLVARRVAVLLVHLAEAIDVADDHGHRAVAAECALELQLEQLLEGAAVEQPGEGVRAVGVGDAFAERPQAYALAQRDARQREGAGGGHKRSENACRLHLPVVIGRRFAPLKR